MSDSHHSPDARSPYPHQKSTQLIESCATAFRVRVDESDTYRWSAALTLAKALDTIVDEDHIYDSGIYLDRLLAGSTMPYTSADESDFMRHAYHDLSEASQGRWQNAATQLGPFALRRIEAATVYDYAQTIFEESELMADVLLVENEGMRQDRCERDGFNVWMRQMARTAFICDTISDFIRDHNEGNVSIQPTPKATAMLGRYALKELAAFSRITPMPVYTAIARRSVTKTTEKMSQPGFWSQQFRRKRVSI